MRKTLFQINKERTKKTLLWIKPNLQLNKRYCVGKLFLESLLLAQLSMGLETFKFENSNAGDFLLS